MVKRKEEGKEAGMVEEGDGTCWERGGRVGQLWSIMYVEKENGE